MKFIPGIKHLWLRRCVMVTVTPFCVFWYMYLGLRHMIYEFKPCWNFQHPAD